MSFYFQTTNSPLEQANVPRGSVRCSGRSNRVCQPLRYSNQTHALHDGTYITCWGEKMRSLRRSRSRLRSAQNPDLIEQLVGAIFGKKVAHCATYLAGKFLGPSVYLHMLFVSSLKVSEGVKSKEGVPRRERGGGQRRGRGVPKGGGPQNMPRTLTRVLPLSHHLP